MSTSSKIPEFKLSSAAEGPLGRLGLLGLNTTITRSAVSNEGLISLGLGSVTRMQTNLTSGGVLALSTGDLRITGNLTLTTASVVRVRSASAAVHGSLSVSGQASLAGALHAVFTWSPPHGTTFAFLTAGSRTGGFPVVVNEGLAPGQVVQVQFAGASANVTVA